MTSVNGQLATGFPPTALAGKKARQSSSTMMETSPLALPTTAFDCFWQRFELLPVEVATIAHAVRTIDFKWGEHVGMAWKA